jgi:hypothetical protein
VRIAVRGDTALPPAAQSLRNSDGVLNPMPRERSHLDDLREILTAGYIERRVKRAKIGPCPMYVPSFFVRCSVRLLFDCDFRISALLLLHMEFQFVRRK